MDKIDKQKIIELLESYKTALNTGNTKMLEQLFCKDSLFMPSETMTAIGLQNVLSAHEAIFLKGNLKVDIYIEDIEIDHDFAFAVTNSVITVSNTGLVNTEDYRELFVFEKIYDEWKIARFMFNKLNAENSISEFDRN
ncbi:nuclear transport factor 2 family protein [Tamlana fucoidanivorans]|uniref:Nuclear transport factor 2 family protein n=1 Tax=Allotamlana fucoidanivorans TaxID=2583814 RepID=A0A5C4SN94_9FLAO|nr:nuclear transport factor 2 family protein [Tamlana fucoidanivorans]TNJ45635.1 nuclear transport factor 2 family protein [Tamlana fucoidanivorans]